VRHHITYLLADGLIIAEEERHGRRASSPGFTHFPRKGLERFPSRYLRLTNRLLDQLKSTLPEEEVKSLFSRMAKDMAADYAQKVKGMPIEGKLEIIKKLLERKVYA